MSAFGLVFLLAVMSCGSGCSGSPDTGGRPDAGSADGPKCPAADAQVSVYCAATYDEQIEAARGKCTQLGWTDVYTYSMDGFLVYRVPGDFYPGAACAYDEGTGLFAGYEFCNDIAGSDGCFCRSVGRVPDITDAGNSAKTLICPSDGGSGSDQ